MFLDKSLSIALLFSAMVHALVFLPLPVFKRPFIKKDAQITVTYLMPKVSTPKKTQVKQEAIQVEKTIQPQKQPLIKTVKISKASDRHTKIEIPPELPKEKEALYLDYYQLIREKIKRTIINNYPRYIACGEVRLYFVLKADGNLEQIDVVEADSSPNRTLKEVAQRSVYQAAPFLPFPKDLGQEQLSFNVVVSFELEN